MLPCDGKFFFFLQRLLVRMKEQLGMNVIGVDEHSAVVRFKSYEEAKIGLTDFEQISEVCFSTRKKEPPKVFGNRG